ncbi:MAG: hypothetical protein ACOX56_02355 [Acholeplasmataceae bacterium]|jgi:hypothetical protein
MKKFRKILIVLLIIFGGFYLVGCEKNEDKKQVETIVNEIFENNNSIFISEGTDGNILFNYDALAGVNLLNKNGYKFDLTKIVSKDKVSNYLNSAVINGEGDAFKLLQLARAYGLPIPESIKNFTRDLASVSSFYSYPMALTLINTFNNNQTLLTTILADIPTVHTNEWFDADTAAFILATSTTHEVNKSGLYEVIESKITPNGVKSWDDNPGASSTAMVIIAYTSNKVSLTYDNGTNLLHALLNFYDNQKHGFKANAAAEDVDLMFATPQSFAALAIYLASLKSKKAPNLYY